MIIRAKCTTIGVAKKAVVSLSVGQFAEFHPNVGKVLMAFNSTGMFSSESTKPCLKDDDQFLLCFLETP